MPTYILLSNLTDDGAKALQAKPKRLQEVNKEIEKFGAKVTAQYAVLGLYDFVSIVECPDNETIARVSVELASRGSVRLITLPAMPVANFVRNLKGRMRRKVAAFPGAFSLDPLTRIWTVRQFDEYV